MKSWETIGRETLLDCGKYLTVENHTIKLPSGKIISDWPWLIMPDYINVVAVTEDEKFLCFRQIKYGIEGTSLAVVGGYIETGEDPLEAARRELLEETGYTAPDWVNLGRYVVDGNRGAGGAHLFLARNAQQVAQPHADDLEEQQLLLLTRTQVEVALAAGEFKVLAWATVVSLALAVFKQQSNCGKMSKKLES